jgi:hypothetical protein
MAQQQLSALIVSTDASFIARRTKLSRWPGIMPSRRFTRSAIMFSPAA